MTNPTITNMQAMQVARGIGAIVEAGLAPVFYSHHQLHLFAQDVYKLGRNAGLEQAKAEAVHWQKVSDTNPNGDGNQHGALLASVIESLKDNTP